MSDERELTCTSCGQTILVCGYVDDLDPAVYRGVVCGCRQAKTDTRPASMVALDQARAAATGQGIPYR